MAAAPKPFEGHMIPGYFIKYGMMWPKGTQPVAIHLAMFREKLAKRIPWDMGGLEPPHHFKILAKTFWPEDAPEGHPKFIWHSWAWKMLCRSCSQQYLGIAGCGGLGKTEFYAIWVIIQFLADPENTMCMVTSTTVAISKKKIWGKIITYWTPLEKLGMPGKLLDSLGVIKYVDAKGDYPKGDTVGICLITGEKTKEKENIGKIIGIHPPRVVFCADELSELSEAITEAFYSNLSRGNEYAQFIGISNPDSRFDPFGKFAEPKKGWDSITVEDEEWETKRGICLHFDTLKNPRIVDGDERCKWMDTQESINKEIEIHGGNSASFWRMFRGFWCPSGMIDLVYTETEIIGYGANQKEKSWLGPAPIPISFLDPGFTNGGDRSVAVFGVLGLRGDQTKVLEYREHLVFKEDVTSRDKTHSQQLANWWREQCEKRGVIPDHAGYDSTGAGGPFGEIVSMLWSHRVLGVHFGGRASDTPVSTYDQTLCSDRYANRVTEIWYSAKEPMRTGQIKGLSPEIIQELCLRKKIEEKGLQVQTRIRVQPKVQMKMLIGKSPDLADSAMGMCQLARERLGFSSSKAMHKMHKEPDSVKHKNFKTLFQKYNIFAGRL